MTSFPPHLEELVLITVSFSHDNDRKLGGGNHEGVGQGKRGHLDGGEVVHAPAAALEERRGRLMDRGKNVRAVQHARALVREDLLGVVDRRALRARAAPAQRRYASPGCHGRRCASDPCGVGRDVRPIRTGRGRDVRPICTRVVRGGTSSLASSSISASGSSVKSLRKRTTSASCEGRGMSSKYEGRDEACPVSTEHIPTS